MIVFCAPVGFKIPMLYYCLSLLWLLLSVYVHCQLFLFVFTMFLFVGLSVCCVMLFCLSICSTCTPNAFVLKARIQKHRVKPLLFHDKCCGFFYVHYTTHGTYTFTSHPKDEAIMVKCLAQGHKRRDRPGRDSNPHSDNART